MRVFIKFFLILSAIIYSTTIVYAQLQTDSNKIRTRVGNPREAPILTVIPPPPQNIRQGLIDEFGTTMNGFDQNHLLWAWERFWAVSQTRFTELVRGSVIEVQTEGLSSRVGCFGGETTVLIGQYTPREFFQFVLLHELGHAIQSCYTRDISLQIEQQNAFSEEGAISYYAANAAPCSGSNSYNEDYADMLAYFLDRTAGFSSGPSGCGPSSPPNPYYQEQGYDLHMDIARRILLQ